MTGRRHWPIDSRDRTAGNFAEPHISTTISAAYSLEDTALRLPVAPLNRSNESPPDSHNTVVTPISSHDSWSLYLENPLLFGYPQVCEHPVSLFNQGINSGPFIIDNYELDVNVTQSQSAQSRLHRPQIDWGSSQEPPLPYDNQATIPVSTIVYHRST